MIVIPFVRAGQQAGGDFTLDRTHSVQSAGYASPKRMFFHVRVLKDLMNRTGGKSRASGRPPPLR